MTDKKKKKPTTKRKLTLDVENPKKGQALTSEDLENVAGGRLIDYQFGPSGVGETSSTCCHCDVCPSPTPTPT